MMTKGTKMLLAIDTATHWASLALYDEANRRILGEETWYSVNNHTVELMPRLARLSEQQRLTPADLGGLVVSQGPGSFTGLRIGLGLAKGLALSRKLPIVGVPTLDVVARPHMDQRSDIWAILQAGRGRVCVGNYVRYRGRWRRRGEYEITTLDKVCDRVESSALFCGELSEAEVVQIRQRLGEAVAIATPAASLRRASYLAELGWERLARGDSDDPATLSPIYLHHPQIDA
jgi:tRNA threonylcarbamoyladenosine biosynthesis protein TsaB